MSMLHNTNDADYKHGNGKTMIFGLGETGYACARFLYDNGIHFAAVDSSSKPPLLSRISAEMPKVPVHTGSLDVALFAQCKELIVSPGIDPRLPLLQLLRQKGVRIISEIDLFKRHCEAPVLAVTGTNGKSTVVSMLAAMASQAGINCAAGGNLGPPAVSLLHPDVQLYVLELSSFQLQSSSEALPVAASCVLNVSSDHVERHENMHDYAKMKTRIYQAAKVAVLNRDDELAAMLPSTGYSEVWSFSVRQAPQGETQFGVVRESGVSWLMRGTEKLLPRDELPLPGEHNTANYLAAFAMGAAIGLSNEHMGQALSAFTGLPHRGQLVAEHGSVCWINDSKATNCAAAAAAVRGFAHDNNIVLIAGGQAKDDDFSELATAMQGRVHTVVLLGSDTKQLAMQLKGVGKLLQADDMRHAVSLAAEHAAKGDKVLLSPAGASFDLYGNYAERGDAFVAAVQKIVGVAAHG